MGDKIDILKIVLDFLKGNKVLLLIVSTALASGAAGYNLPAFIKAEPVKVTVEVPKNDKLDQCMKEISKLKRWHE